MSKSKDKHIDGLMECVMVEVSVQCGSCSEVTADNVGDDFDLAHELYHQGWRVNELDEAVCPKCRKKNKSKK
jgi:hypothetical protein